MSDAKVSKEEEKKVSKEEAKKQPIKKQASLYRAPSGDAEWGDDEWENQGDDASVKASPPPETKAPAFDRQVSYVIVEPERLTERQEALIKQTSDLLFVTGPEASSLLRHYQWNGTKLQQEWFANADKVRKTVGLSSGLPPDLSKRATVQCETAFCDEVPPNEGFALNCGHFFCNGCWTGYLNSQLNSGRTCIFATCMGLKCKLKHNHRVGCTCTELVPETVVRKYVTDAKLIEKYERWVLDSFVEGQRSIKWCPNPQCKRAVEYKSGGSKEIQCRCGNHWCFSCTESAHSPCPCDLAKKWQKSENSTDATEIWLNARTKQCPHCNVRIEKNRACNHMTCSKCGHQFCWLCKEPWSQHGSQTGGYYVCNKYNEEVAKKGETGANDEEKKIINSQRRLQKYEYFYKRYKTAQETIKLTQAIGSRLEAKAQAANIDSSRYAFVMEAIDKLINSRRTIQWMYVLIYYLKECSSKQLYEYQQELLTGETEGLQDVFDQKSELDDLIAMRNDIVTRVRSMDKFRSELIKIVEGGEIEDIILPEADLSGMAVWTCINCHTDNKKGTLLCTSCQACAKHGEIECKACNRGSH